MTLFNVFDRLKIPTNRIDTRVLFSVMNYDEFKRQLGKAAVTAGEFGQLIKLNPNSVTNYSKRGTVPNNLAVIAVLMGEMAENQIDFRGLLQGIELQANKVRGSAQKGKFGGTRNEVLQS